MCETTVKLLEISDGVEHFTHIKFTSLANLYYVIFPGSKMRKKVFLETNQWYQCQYPADTDLVVSDLSMKLLPTEL